MSVEALAWLANRAPGVKPHWMGTLFELCNGANAQGRGSHPPQARLAWVARKDERAIRDDLKAMEAAGLIRKGDQRMVAHLPPDKRPVVWDLAMELDRGPRPEPGKPGRPPRKRGEPEIPPEPETPPFPGLSGGSTDPGGTVDPPVSDLRKHENGGVSDVKRGDPDTRQHLEKETRRTSLLGEEEQSTPPGSTTAKTPPPPSELTAEERSLAAELCERRPDWSPVSMRKVLAAPEIRERTDRALVRLAFLIAADDRRTTTPYRLKYDACPAWAQAVAELYPAEAAAAAEPLRLIGDVPPCGDPGCDAFTRTLVHPDNGHPLPGRPRCPRCHPQSPAVSP